MPKIQGTILTTGKSIRDIDRQSPMRDRLHVTGKSHAFVSTQPRHEKSYDRLIRGAHDLYFTKDSPSTSRSRPFFPSRKTAVSDRHHRQTAARRHAKSKQSQPPTNFRQKLVVQVFEIHHGEIDIVIDLCSSCSMNGNKLRRDLTLVFGSLYSGTTHAVKARYHTYLTQCVESQHLASLTMSCCASVEIFV